MYKKCPRVYIISIMCMNNGCIHLKLSTCVNYTTKTDELKNIGCMSDELTTPVS